MLCKAARSTVAGRSMPGVTASRFFIGTDTKATDNRAAHNATNIAGRAVERTNLVWLMGTHQTDGGL